jgi:hypothetical protein
MRYILKISMLLFVLVSVTSCNDVDSINKEVDLLGTWELKQYYNKSTDTFVNVPDNADPVVITFKEGIFEGNTGRNTFFGDYITESDVLLLLEYATTEVAESEWGGKFADTIVSTYNSSNKQYQMLFSVDGNTLKIEYKPTLFMYFEMY